MTTLYIFCEGRTEERFVRSVLFDHLVQYDISVHPLIVETKRTPNQKFKGGIREYSKIQKQLKRLCLEHPQEWVTTMIDYYAFPDDAPFSLNPSGNLYDKINSIEADFLKDIGTDNFIPNLMLHEFEALLFSNVSAFSSYYSANSNSPKINRLRNMCSQFPSPEHINSDPRSAPSKRIIAQFDDMNGRNQ